MKVDRYALHFGPYQTPRFRYGQRVECEVRGEVEIVGLSAGHIPWPLGRVDGNSNRALVIYKGLGKAIRQESATAICHWWGVTPQTVSRWRGVIGIGPHTAGSRRQRSSIATANYPKVRAALHSKAHEPKRAAKIAAAKRGKPRPAEVVEAMRQANIGRKHSAATRKAMSEAHARQKPTPKHLAALRTGYRRWRDAQ